MRKFKNILILAAGDNTRFWPLRRKSHFRFLGKPVILHQINIFKKFAEKVVIVINPQDVQSNGFLFKENNVEIVVQKETLFGQAGAILSAENKVKGEVLILNAEDIFDTQILYECLNVLKNQIDYLFVAKKVESYFPGGYLKFRQNKLLQVVEKPKIGEEPSDIVKLVVDYFRDFDQLLETVRKTKGSSDNRYEQAINLLLTRVKTSHYLIYDRFWHPLKYPWHVLPVMKHFLGLLPNKEIRIGKNVKIAKTAKITGPCFIDDNSVVGDFAMVRQSHIGKDSTIGGFSEVTRSYLGNNVSLHRNYVGDSVIDDGGLMGAGAATANFRFDEKPIKSSFANQKIDTGLVKFGTIIGKASKIGVNATLLPGVKIGSKTYIGPGETIYEDVEDNTFILRGRIRKNSAV